MAALALETRFTEKQLLEDFHEHTRDAMLHILQERAEKAEDEERQRELRSKFG